MPVSRIINTIFEFYFILIILRIFLTWIPSIDWNQQPIKFVREITDAYLDVFRRIIPPVGMIDFSPIVAIIVLQIIQALFVSIAASIAG